MSLLGTKTDKAKTDVANAALLEAQEWVENRRSSNLHRSEAFGATAALISIAASLREIAAKLK
jgi:hypothetical protein